ncbi:MAG: cobyrinate a,c-diamide synthase [Ferrimicrobium sp.]|nr:cobyrinate a,c-diamide synthase [Ferrimicrobium sp.]
MVAGTASGVGKTSITLGLLAALATSVRISAAKVGPDYIDPHLHAAATHRASYNIDPVLTGPLGVRASLARAARETDLVVVEGVMGLFDGTDLPDLPADTQPSASSPAGSTAQVARLTGLPVILVIDCAHLSQSTAAIALGYQKLNPEVKIVGVILNNLKSATHEALIRQAMAAIDVEILGAIPSGGLPERDSRHLGLLTAEEAPWQARQWIQALGASIRTHVELTQIITRAGRIDPHPLVAAVRMPPELVTRPVIAYSNGPAASFIYPENLDLLTEAGAEVIGFDPRHESIPPQAGLIWLHGGYPENYRAEISANAPLHQALRQAARSGLPIIAECGGHLLLGVSLEESAMSGVLPFQSTIGTRPRLGYRQVLLPAQSPLSLIDRHELPAHEFHYARSSEDGNALLLRTARESWRAGFARPSMISSYLHWHLGADSRLPASLVQIAARQRLSQLAQEPQR